MTATRPVPWRKRARRLRLTGIVVLLAAAALIVSANFLGGLLVALLGVGNMLAAGSVATTGTVPASTRALIVVGGAGFVVVMVAGSVLALLRS
ncbi:hypothetical protein EV383_5753 [Pseudonocardia sediminis]|uniref:Uncharacterized protein n=1 Tax=Pseudonocardia sediminis TaxID=1397368 RepID=A0A4Q7V5M2_PSEST|nr:hypothetical protein [Pseudonocardia sediminis]RZT88804.1 hypothetical protein EV383_5753 [Pseudonocardia sediminis]